MEKEIKAFDQDEFDEALNEAKNDNTANCWTLKLNRPFEWEGSTYTELHFDLEDLTGEDSLKVEQELTAQGVMVMVPTFSGPYLTGIAAKACQEPVGTDALKHLRISDFNRIRTRVRNFLLASEQ